jgi:hypothetical protein
VRLRTVADPAARANSYPRFAWARRASIRIETRSGYRQGRHRYYRLAGHEVAAALEALGLISPALPVRSLRQSREAAALAEARTCYDHLAPAAAVW